MADLVPHPLDALARRMFRELDASDTVFDLPARKFFTGSTGNDLSVRFHRHRASSPLGPAAGPHTQMAQNIVLAWLGGGRIMELKTVQILDELEIPRPCIDMQTIGYNAEWSQELKIEDSRDEYVKGAMLVDMLRASGRLELVEGFDDTVYDISVGYDLAGIRSERVLAFIRGMMDTSDAIDRLRRSLPRALAPLRDLDFRTRLADTLTLSTFHGCPPHEIEGIIEFLMRELGLHCVIKFNPMLLGARDVRALLNDAMGYSDIRVPDSAFEKDTTWEQAVEMVERLERTASELGLSLGVKFSNTLIVENHRGFIPQSEKQVYLSGPPLHVLAVNLVGRFRERFGDRFPISFSAGIDRKNFADAVAMGLVPITVCSDLLKTGGYGRLPGYHHDLIGRMNEVGAASVDDFVLRAYGLGEDALEHAAPSLDAETKRVCLAALGDGGDPRAAAGDALHDAWLSSAKLLNTRCYVERATSDPRYTHAKNARPPRKIGRHLRLFDCVTCDICVPVCPNDANFTFGSGPVEIPIVKLRSRPAGWEWCVEGHTTIAERHQIGTFADFCNECGNCDVFCPEDGGPYRVKPRFFGSESEWRRLDSLDGFYLARGENGDLVLGRFDGDAYRLALNGEDVSCEGPGFAVCYRRTEPAATVEGTGPDEIDLTYAGIMEYIRRAVLDGDRVSYVNARFG